MLLCTLLGALIMAQSATAAPLTQQGWQFPKIQYLQIKGGGPALKLNEVEAAKNWQPLTQNIPNFGYTTDAYWFRFSLPAVQEINTPRIVEVAYPQLDNIQFHLLRDGKPIDSVTTGDHRPFYDRPIDHPHFLFPVKLEPGAHYEVLMRVQTQGTLQVPIRIWEPVPLFEHLMILDELHSVYYGILIVIIVFNLFVFLALREATYFYYVVATFGYLLLMATLRGTTFPLLWPNTPWLQNQSMLVSIPLAALGSALFARSFLDLKQDNPWLDRAVKVSIYACSIALLGTFLLDYNESVRLSVGLAIPTCLLLALTGPIQWIRGSRAARLYSLAWAVLTLGSVVTALNKYGLFPTNFVTEFSIELGSAIEALMLTLALAERLYREREDKVRAQDARLREHAERRQAELRLMEQALHHPTTGMPNRACFEILLRDLIQRDSTGRHAIGVLQLKNYHAIHKTLGHTNTDKVMQAAAQRFNLLAAELPGIRLVEEDEQHHFAVASLEVDTFAFVLDADEARTQQRRIARCLEALRDPIDYMGMQLPLDPIAGVALYPDHGVDSNTLIREAYIAQESEEARDRGLAYYQPELDIYSADRLTLVSDLKRALARKELALHYQPKMSLEDYSIVGVEALIRWPACQDRIQPEELIRVAEQTGLIKPLTRWVMEHALEARDHMLESGYDLSVSVNISPHNLREAEFPLFVKRLMTSNHQHAGKIVLEVTETSMMQDPGNSLRALRSLDMAGIPVSIDDFGSGYSSLSYIKRLPAREIKIDRSLIADLLHQQDDRVIVQTTINMCHSLGYSVVAEGVEEQEIINLLDSMGCDMVQGYVLTPPLPLDELKVWLDRHQQTRASLRA